MGSYLAGKRAATIFYFSDSTQENTDCSDIEEADPLALLRAFADRTGLRIQTPRPDILLIGGAWSTEKSGVEITARLVYADQFAYRPAGEISGIEWAVIQALGSHRIGYSNGVSQLRYFYWWIEGEKDTILVTVRLDRPERVDPEFSTFKARVRAAGAGWLVQEVWQAEDSPGPLVPEFSDDIDGDGVRDYVLDYEARDNSHYALISGVDGRLLARFRGWIAYDPGRPGPKRIAVRELLGEYREPPQGVHVLDFSGGTPAEISIPRKKQGTGAGHDSSPYGPDAAVSRLLGDPGRVKSIVGGTYSNEERASPEAMRKAQERRNLPRCELGEQAAGACERVHFRYISPGLKKRMEDAAKRTADSK